MLEKILSIIQSLDLKGWSSLKAQQRLTIFMAVAIIVFFSTSVMLFIQNQTVRDTKNAERDIWVSKYEACTESKFKLVEKYEILFYETRNIKEEIKHTTNENTTP